MRFKKSYTQEQEINILALFYRTELDRGEIIIDNSSKYISKKLNIRIQTINACLNSHLNYKFKKIADRIID